ncbi:transposase [Slackia piriformis]|uniref:transposase n=1 Tax=Slackia piriformis TaxID=626934 RepID=UPI003D714D3F
MLPRGEPPSDRQATERPAIAGICEKSQFRYGYRRVADTLRKAAGIRIADKTALKAVREEGLLLRTRRRRRRRFRMGRAGSTGCPPAGSRSSGRGSPGPCPAKETASTTRRPRTSSRWPRPSFATIGRDGPDVFERDPEKHIDRYSNVRIKRRLDGSGPVECRLSRAA